MSMLRVVLVLAFVTVHTAAGAQSVVDPHVFTYVRLGASTVMADGTRRSPAAGFGLRAEMETFAIDVSGLNFALNYDASDPSREMAVGSLLKIQGLKFFTPGRDGSPYVGAGVSWGHVNVGRAARVAGQANSWHGKGLQGELTVGYELPRSSGIRFLVQADASVPFFAAHSETFAYPAPGIVVSTGRESRVIPSVVLSVGVGWRKR
jgi:hypothetical protein